MKKGNNIYKRKDGRWEARYPRTRANGQIQYGYCYGKTYAEALKKRREMEELIEMGIETKPIHAKTVADLCDQWLRHKALHVKPASYDKYVYSINAHIRADLGPVSIQALDDEHIDRFTAGLFDKGLRVKTIRDILSILNSILAYAAKRFPRLRRIQIVFPRDDKAPARVLSEEEQTRLIEYLRADLDPCKFGTLLALMTGMRIGEICALQWKDISLADSLLVVSNTMIRLRGHPEESKKNKSRHFHAQKRRLHPNHSFESSASIFVRDVQAGRSRSVCFDRLRRTLHGTENAAKLLQAVFARLRHGRHPLPHAAPHVRDPLRGSRRGNQSVVRNFRSRLLPNHMGHVRASFHGRQAAKSRPAGRQDKSLKTARCAFSVYKIARLASFKNSLSCSIWARTSA